ncbi:hypothetical protein M9H77_30316 [Catharanthus roseus]|uniref:Uncharacterized protein n=1 Tax=Catharanthus roseus TaxID=4058 RepID=A0ACB9ZYZ1_CATRO|nr:hypothetical protein M9H77_30316 [Catharanthus roseus]
MENEGNSLQHDCAIKSMRRRRHTMEFEGQGESIGVKLFLCYGDSSMSFSSNLFLFYLMFSFKELKLFLDAYVFLELNLARSTSYSCYISYSCYKVDRFLFCGVMGQRDYSLIFNVPYQVINLDKTHLLVVQDLFHAILVSILHDVDPWNNCASLRVANHHTFGFLENNSYVFDGLNFPVEISFKTLFERAFGFKFFLMHYKEFLFSSEFETRMGSYFKLSDTNICEFLESDEASFVLRIEDQRKSGGKTVLLIPTNSSISFLTNSCPTYLDFYFKELKLLLNAYAFREIIVGVLYAIFRTCDLCLIDVHLSNCLSLRDSRRNKFFTRDAKLEQSCLDLKCWHYILDVNSLVVDSFSSWTPMWGMIPRIGPLKNHSLNVKVQLENPYDDDKFLIGLEVLKAFLNEKILSFQFYPLHFKESMFSLICENKKEDSFGVLKTNPFKGGADGMTRDAQGTIELLQGSVTKAIARRMEKEHRVKRAIFKMMIKVLALQVIGGQEEDFRRSKNLPILKCASGGIYRSKFGKFGGLKSKEEEFSIPYRRWALLNISGNCYTKLVKEFYVNMFHKMDKDLSTIISTVKAVRDEAQKNWVPSTEEDRLREINIVSFQKIKKTAKSSIVASSSEPPNDESEDDETYVVSVKDASPTIPMDIF